MHGINKNIQLRRNHIFVIEQGEKQYSLGEIAISANEYVQNGKGNAAGYFGESPRNRVPGGVTIIVPSLHPKSNKIDSD